MGLDIALQESYQQLIRDLEQCQVDCKALESEKDRIETTLRNFSWPEGIWWGVGVLIYLAFSGILLPMAFIPTEPNGFRDWHRWMVFFGFSSGLIAVLAYIVWEIRKLKR